MYCVQPQTQNIVGGQDGVSLILDIGVLDVTTCKALPNAQVEVWQGKFHLFIFRPISNFVPIQQTRKENMAIFSVDRLLQPRTVLLNSLPYSPALHLTGLTT